MVEAIAEPALRGRIIAWVDAEMVVAGEQDAAFRAVANRLIAEGFSEAFLQQFAHQVVREVWQARSRQSRRANLNGTTKINGEYLQSDAALMDAPWYPFGPGGEPVRLGDFNKEQCQAIQGEFVREIRALSQDRNFFVCLAKRLTGDEIVRDAFTDDELRALWDKSRVAD